LNTINWLPKALRQLRKIEPSQASKSRSSVSEELSDRSQARHVKALKEYPYGYRLRVGNFRVFFEYDRTVHIVTIEEIRKRVERTY
jgi:mRNA-degrading endonuclease RelE of RelBE toxin-antitoxin system